MCGSSLEVFVFGVLERIVQAYWRLVYFIQYTYGLRIEPEAVQLSISHLFSHTVNT